MRIIQSLDTIPAVSCLTPKRGRYHHFDLESFRHIESCYCLGFESHHPLCHLKLQHSTWRIFAGTLDDFPFMHLLDKNWNRPIHKNERVAPSRLPEHRQNFQFLGPGCLCALLQPATERFVFTEAAIYIKMSGEYIGEYVTECAKGCCGYLGQSITLEFKGGTFCLCSINQFHWNDCIWRWKSQ